MKQAEILVVKINTIGRKGNASHGPFVVQTDNDFKAIIQKCFDRMLKGTVGYVLVNFANKLWLCERNPIDPHKPYVRHTVKYHPMAPLFFTNQKVS